MPLEEVIAANLDDLFPGMEIVHQSLFRVTRDTDYDVSDEADDLLLAVEEEVRRRRFGEVVRLEISPDMEPRLLDQLVEAMNIDAQQVFEAPGLIGLDDLTDIYSVSGFRELRYRPGRGSRRRSSSRAAAPTGRSTSSPRCGRATSWSTIPTTPSPAPWSASSARPSTTRTCSRSSRPSTGRAPTHPLVPALIEASERGKQAVCLVELKARFDESANIRWARALEEAGVHVVYGIPGLKTHVKCVLVARREGDGVRNYVHIGTGNYNPKTARIYTDFGLFTASQEIGDDIAEMFNYLTGYARPSGYRKVLVAPFNLKDGIVGEIDRGDRGASPSSPARIRMKMNSLLDAVVHPGPLSGLAGRRPGRPQRPGHLRAAPRCAGDLGEHSGRLDRRALSGALADLLVRAAR